MRMYVSRGSAKCLPSALLSRYNLSRLVSFLSFWHKKQTSKDQRQIKKRRIRYLSRLSPTEGIHILTIEGHGTRHACFDRTSRKA